MIRHCLAENSWIWMYPPSRFRDWPGAKYEGNPWDLIIDKVKAKEALPIVDILKASL